MKILIVDDSSTVRVTISEELKKGGYEVVEASDGIEGLIRAAVSPPPDLITLDIEMPRLNGFETCRKLREEHYARFFTHSKDCRVPIIFITGNDTLEDRKKGFQLGAADFITKPFAQGEVLAAADNILKPKNTLEGPTALVVDDTVVARRIVSESLKRDGLTVIEAENGIDAFEIMCNRTAKINIVITDLVMPGMDGRELCRKIRNELHLSDLPVIFLTAMADQSELLEVFKAGATDYLIKPFIKEELFARISVHLEKTQLNNRLRETVNELKSLMRIKDNLLALCSHDLRSPLDGILASADLLLDKDYIKAEGRQDLIQIKKSGEVLLNLINDILDLSRIPAEGTKLKSAAATPSATQDAETVEESSLPAESEATDQKAFDEKAVLDRSELLERVGGDEKLSKEILDIFIKDIPEQFETLRDALKDNDATLVERQVHTIKGSSANIGAHALADAALEMEKAVKGGDANFASALANKLESEFEKLQLVLGP